MAQSKYSEEVAQTIVDTIACTGRDEDGCKAVGISRDTFYKWMNRYPDFSDRVKKAKSEWRETLPEVLVRQANNAFAGYLFGRHERIVHTRKEGYKGDQPFEEEITQRIPVGIPRWAIERVLGQRMHELDALTTLVEAGWLPRWVIQIAVSEIGNTKQAIRQVFEGILPDGDKQIKPGLSDFAADQIRKQILGIESEGVSSLSGSVGSGSESGKGSGEVATGRAELG